MKKSLRISLGLLFFIFSAALLAASFFTSPRLVSNARAAGSTRLYLPSLSDDPPPLTPFPDLCEPTANDYRKGNTLKNCGFSEDLDHWTIVKLSGNPSIYVDDDRPHVYFKPALRIDSSNDFKIALYQKVSADPGKLYYANITILVWPESSSRDDAYRKVGIDPTGGTNPDASTVVWGTEVDTPIDDCEDKICTDLYVFAYARNSTITYFLWIDDDNNGNTYWIDDLGMIKVER